MAHQLGPGMEFAGHRIESVIGRGGMGVVYRAVQLDLDRTVALKVIAPDLCEDVAARERFVQEAKAAARIDHPNVIPVHYSGVEDDQAYLAMRFVPGDDLRTLVRREGPLEPVRAARLLAQVAAALDAIHAAGIVHRDVKPANVLLAEGDHVYVSDFGLAKAAAATGGTTRTGQWVGTLDFAAPEQIRGERVDARCDIYALGGVLHYMLTGRVPYEREGDEAKLWAHVADPPPRPTEAHPGVPAAFDPVVGRAMAKDPADRYPSAGDLARAALAAAAGVDVGEPERVVARGEAAPAGDIEEPTVSSPRPSTPAPPQRRRRRLPVLVIAAAAVLAAGAAALTMGRADDDVPERRPPTLRTVTEVGSRPNAVAVAGGYAWVTSFTNDRITLVDVERNQTLPGPQLGSGATDIVTDGEFVWVAMARDGLVRKIHAETQREVDPLPVPTTPSALAVDDESLWVSTLRSADGEDEVLRFDKETGRRLARIEVFGGVSDLTTGADAVWATTRGPDEVVRISIRAAKVNRRITVGRNPAAVAFGQGFVWVSNETAGTVSRVDPETFTSAELTAGNRPQGLVVADGRVWVANRADHTVTTLDARTSRLVGEPVPTALNPLAITATPDEIWVTAIGDDAVTRIPIRGRAG